MHGILAETIDIARDPAYWQVPFYFYPDGLVLISRPRTLFVANFVVRNVDVISNGQTNKATIPFSLDLFGRETRKFEVNRE